MRRAAKILVLLPWVAACQQVEPEQETGGLRAPDAVAAMAVKYSCDTGGDLSVTYDAGGIAHVALDGHTLNLMATDSTRGTAYAADGVRWETVNEAGQERGSLTLADGTVRQCARPSPTAAPAPVSTSCRADQLQLKAGETDAAMGHRQQEMHLSLKGAQACILPQWPELELVTETSASPPKVERTSDSYFTVPEGPKRIELKPSQVVRFYLGWGVIPHEGEGETVCPQVTGWKLNAPGGGQLAPVSAQITACGGKVTVSAFAPVANGGDAAP